MSTRMSMIGMSLSVLLGGATQVRAASNSSDLWSDILLGAEDDSDQQQGAVEDDSQQNQQDQSNAVGGGGGGRGPGSGGNNGGGNGGGSGGGQDANALNPNVRPLGYFLGAWDCTAQAADANGVDHTYTKSVFYSACKSGNWVGAHWSKTSSAFNHHDSKGEPDGGALEGYNAYEQSFVKLAVGTAGGYGYSMSPGFDGNDMIWSGEGWNWGSAHSYHQVAISKVDADNYTVTVASSTDGTTYSPVGTGTCTRAAHH